MKKKSQNYIIGDHLKRYGSITALQAVELYGIYRLSARIFDLRASGWAIDSDKIETVNRFGEKVHPTRYIFISEPGAAA